MSKVAGIRNKSLDVYPVSPGAAPPSPTLLSTGFATGPGKTLSAIYQPLCSLDVTVPGPTAKVTITVCSDIELYVSSANMQTTIGGNTWTDVVGNNGGYGDCKLYSRTFQVTGLAAGTYSIVFSANVTFNGGSTGNQTQYNGGPDSIFAMVSSV